MIKLITHINNLNINIYIYVQQQKRKNLKVMRTERKINPY